MVEQSIYQILHLRQCSDPADEVMLEAVLKLEKTVYTVHGFTKEFAKTLHNVCGVKAHPLE